MSGTRSDDVSSESSDASSTSSESPAFDDSMEPDNDGILRHEARVAGLAVRHVKLAHLDQVLSHVAKSVRRAIDKGRLNVDELENWDDAKWEEVIQSVAKANPHVALPPKAKPQLPTIIGKRKTPY